MSTIEIWHFLRYEHTEIKKWTKLYYSGAWNCQNRNGRVLPGTDKVLENVVKHVFNGMLGVQLNTVL